MASHPVVTDPARVDDAYFSLVSLAKYAGLSVRTLRGYLVHPGHPLPHYRVGGKLLVKRSEFDTWMNTFRTEHDATALNALVNDIVRGL